ncbi:hypothetical protein IMSAGC013_04242 [Lachnospiraceae bacterium]|jgi:hypothetical protein|nr:hypothetical protein IMSAGC013_04242 [Lachnospiraceae bacterium]
MLPKSIENKIDQLNKTLEKAHQLKNDIEKWAEKRGIDISSNEWYECVVNNCNSVSGIFKEGLEEIFNNGVDD